MRDRHKKPEYAEDETDFILAQQKLNIKIDRHKIKEHPFAEPPKEQGSCNKKQISIQISSLKICTTIDSQADE